MAIDDSAIAIGTLVKVENCAHAEVGEIVVEFLEMFGGEDFFSTGGLRAAGHENGL